MTDDLLIRFIEKKCSLQEARAVISWIEENNGNRKHYIQLQTTWAIIEMNRAQGVDADAVKYIMKQIRKQRTIRYLYAAGVAACIAFAVLFSSIRYFSPSETIYPDYEALLTEDISNNKDITLILNNKKIEVADTSPVVSYHKKGEIIINDTLTIVEEKGEKINEEEVLNTIRIPYGKRSKLILDDGTIVHLNAGSSLVYPAAFGKMKREVFLEGEAYFEVKKEESGRKFVVKTTLKDIEVLGTRFNVSSDKERNLFEAVLVNGSIALETNHGRLEMIPNQYYGFSGETQSEELKTVDVLNYISWKDGKLQFQKEIVANVIRKLEKIYNIHIELSDKKYDNFLITGNLNLKSTAKETMDILMSIMVPDYEKIKSVTQTYNITYNQ